MAKNEVRIIGGKWRGRKLKFPDANGLRPSQDRGRETLFNWLAPWLDDAVCLDLFAGSGVLGFEALSRGAARADLLDNSRAVISALTRSKDTLEAIAAKVINTDAVRFLRTNKQPYNLVFVDPPFATDLARTALQVLAEGTSLAPDALVYVEQNRHDDPGWDDTVWDVHRDKAFGDSRAVLLTLSAG